MGKNIIAPLGWGSVEPLMLACLWLRCFSGRGDVGLGLLGAFSLCFTFCCFLVVESYPVKVGGCF